MLEKVKFYLKSGVLFAIKWRYLIALVVFVFCLAFKLHGSSIGVYDDMFVSETTSEENILGEGRSVRSDEWLVHTPYYMSQSYNNFEKTSHMMSLEGQDMILGYNAPVMDITLLGKPFTWGYVLLGNEYGLSWYWCMKLILLILVTFELCMIVTRKNKKVALFGAILIAFSPLVQWWFVPHIVDVLFWGMAILVLAYHFFVSTGWKRNLMMVLLPLSMVTFALALFPSLQVPIAMMDVALLIAFLVRDKKEITFHKKDIWRIVAMGVYVVGVLLYTIIDSSEAISTLYNTVYPGKRVSTGGDMGLKALFTDPVTFTLPFKDVTYLNNCEVSDFIHFAPLLFMLYPVIYKKMKRDKNMVVGNVMLGCLIVMAVFMLAGFPDRLAKLTLLSYVNRMQIVYGLLATIFTVWGVDMIMRKKLFSWKQILVAILVCVAMYVCFINADDLGYLSWKHYIVIIAGLAALGGLMLRGNIKLFMLGTTVVVLISGLTVNPLAHGISALTAHPLEQKIREITAEDKEAYWLVLNGNIMASVAVANGARTLNMVNFYPDYGKWNLIDDENKHDEIYNRYAHILIWLSAEKTEYLLGENSDSMVVKLSAEDLLKWPVKYLVVTGNLIHGKANDDAVLADFPYEDIYDDTEGDYHIYRRIGELNEN